ncbi:MAG: efflux RND transporter periplasmic adaptor subunit [Hahellaceae bacterium]|jgi:membrane fusion protein (multidrug efflux system)|nr:efflux RND transporter periplasmic adaptor subunit [Hahellaceae bacterium]MCP5212733.1 efflux RND transporter periplasmic adaptor subunit [Hahellaceae bacterium]
MRALAMLLTSFMVMPLLSGCDKQETAAKPVPEVFVIKTKEHPYTPQKGFNARIESRSDVEITAQVSGKLMAIHFKEGDQVSKGADLFDIDPAPFKAALNKAKADLAKADANLHNAEKNFERGAKLVDDGYISASEYDTLEAKKLEAAAALESAKAAVESAEVDLAYTSIKAQQDGRIGRSKPAVGDVVSPQSGALTTLVGQDDMDVVFQLPEKILLATKRADSKIKIEDIVVSLHMPDGSVYPHTATLDYFSNRVDTATGTIESRARINNEGDLLRPGMFVTAVLQLNEPLMGLMVPQAAVQVDQVGTYVLVVDNENMVSRKNITTGDRFGENVLVADGLELDEQVIVRGVQKARPGTTVTVSEYKAATAPSEGDVSDK